jgi:hypothetical protein
MFRINLDWDATSMRRQPKSILTVEPIYRQRDAPMEAFTIGNLKTELQLQRKLWPVNGESSQRFWERRNAKSARKTLLFNPLCRTGFDQSTRLQ